MGRASEQLRAEYSSDGIQLADVQWSFRADDHAADRAARKPRPAAHCEPGNGSSSDSSARKSIRGDGNGGRTRPGDDLESNEHGAGRRAQARVVEFDAKYP